MFPFVTPEPLTLGGLELSAFQLATWAGCVAGAALCVAAAPRHGLRRREAGVLLGHVIICGILGAHLFALLLYHRDRLAQAPWRHVFSVFSGLASLGGVLGGGIGAVAFSRLSGRPLPRVLDCVVTGLPLGWGIGRIGCYLAHDHPGVAHDGFFAVDWPGKPRLDLGLLEAFVHLGLAALLAWALRRRPAPGRITALFLLLYAPSRFALDFLRVSGAEARAAVEAGWISAASVDVRHGGLTAAQWVCLALLPAGVAALRISRTSS